MNLIRKTALHGKHLCVAAGLALCCWLGMGNRAYAADARLAIQHLGDGQSIVRIEHPSSYLLLPIEESAEESKVYVIVNNEVIKSLNVRLARKQVDYFVPLALQATNGQPVAVNVQLAPEGSICWDEMKLSDTFDSTNREPLRPTYHFSPAYGWMNDPNGMVYKDGEYHLFYQYNPYGSMWGNMHWGHAVSRDLLHWEHLPVALAPDALGAIFSGSCVVDTENTAGFGKGAIIAFYTSASERQMQSLAYSTDNGRTFKKYERNPILTSAQRDFRDPKVIWHKETQRWIMVLAVGQELQLYSSPNLREWTYESSFGEGQGAHAGVWECPDLFELPVDGGPQKKWVLVCNINPGGPFGGSATQYFVGSFDGKRFINESPALTKWMDYGKDHYATVTWSNAPDNRTIALAWMSNWEYANFVPTTQYRSANSIPRDLALFTRNGKTYLSSTPSPEVLKLREKATSIPSFKVARTHEVGTLLPNPTGAFEIELTVQSNGANVISFTLGNSKGEEVEMHYNLLDHHFVMDRRKSGQVAFSKSFATATAAPLAAGKTFTLRLFVDKCSLEAFDSKGGFAMTNLVFPSEPYNSLRFTAEGGAFTVTKLNIYPLRLP